MKLLLLFILILLIIPNALAAVIQGKIYDLELNRLDNIIVEINTIPKQRVISQNGEYFFNVPKGDYAINVRALINEFVYSASENISIIDDGEYIIDLFLFPELENISNINIGDNKENKKNIIVYIAIFIIVLIIFFAFKIVRKKKVSPETDEDMDNIYNIIKKEKRVTQKEIRKRSILSEAKISLIIAQLEKEGKIQKIKKGRTNIIILK